VRRLLRAGLLLLWPLPAAAAQCVMFVSVRNKRVGRPPADCSPPSARIRDRWFSRPV